MNFEFLKNKVFETLGISYEGEIKFEKCEGFKVSLSDGTAIVGAENESSMCRALCEMAKAVSEGKKEIHIEKKPHFEWCGVMLDLSRDVALKKEKIKKYIDMIACLGINMLMLYTEDLYEMEGYPFFGYKRGRYSVEDLREIDDYAYYFGIELIPCIQTLGHLESYLCWPEAGKFKDTRWSILPGDKESLKFVEDMFKTCRKAFRSNNIHIGMDEAVWAGTGGYFKKHQGEVIDQYELLFDHLNKVCDLCKKYDYAPIIWSDLFFVDRESGATYTENSNIPDKFKDKIPENVRFMYWEYHGKEKGIYRAVLQRHKESDQPVAFAGAGWSFESFTPNTAYAFKTNIPALDACLETGCDMILNTLWGNGSETSYFTCFPSNALYGEYMWSGAEASEEAAWEMSEFLTKTPKKLYDLADVLHFGLDGDRRLGRKLLRGDVFETVRAQDTGFLFDNLPEEVFKDGEPMNKMFKAADEIEEYVAENGDLLECFKIAAAAIRTCAYKAYIHTNIFKAYKEEDKNELLKIKDEILPACRESYKKLYKLFQNQYTRDNKPFGWEWHCQRVGYQIARIDYAKDMLDKYLSGEIPEIEELEAEQLNLNIYYG